MHGDRASHVIYRLLTAMLQPFHTQTTGDHLTPLLFCCLKVCLTAAGTLEGLNRLEPLPETGRVPEVPEGMTIRSASIRDSVTRKKSFELGLVGKNIPGGGGKDAGVWTWVLREYLVLAGGGKENTGFGLRRPRSVRHLLLRRIQASYGYSCLESRDPGAERWRDRGMTVGSASMTKIPRNTWRRTKLAPGIK